MDKEWIEQLIQDGLGPWGDETRGCEKVKEIADDIAQAHEEEVARVRTGALAIMPCGHHASNAVSADEGTAYCEMCELERQNEKLRELDSVVSDLGPWVSDGSLSPVEVVLRIDDLIEAQQDDVYGLQAQVAVLAGALRHIKDEWFDKWYPADIFVGGPVSDEGVNDVVAIREMIVQALESAPEVLQLDEVEFVASERRGWPALYMYALGNEADGYVEKGEYRGELMGYPETLLETSEAILIILAKPECSANQASGPKSEQELGDE